MTKNKESNKELVTYFKLMLAGGSTALYNYVQEHSLLADYKVGDTFSAKEFAEKFSQEKIDPSNMEQLKNIHLKLENEFKNIFMNIDHSLFLN